jgi:hypothetical protein
METSQSVVCLRTTSPPIRMSNPIGNLREYFMEEYGGSINRAFSQYHDEFVTECESRIVPSALLATCGMGGCH